MSENEKKAAAAAEAEKAKTAAPKKAAAPKREEKREDLSPQKLLREKIRALRNKVGDLTKDSFAEDGGYSYASTSKLLAMIRPIMNDCGLGFDPIVEDSHWMDVTAPNGRPERLFEVKVHYSFEDLDTGEVKDFGIWPGYGQNVGEKGYGAALTYALRYFLTQTFMIASLEDDPEAKGGRKDLKPQAQPKAPVQQAPAEPKPAPAVSVPPVQVPKPAPAPQVQVPQVSAQPKPETAPWEATEVPKPVPAPKPEEPKAPQISFDEDMQKGVEGIAENDLARMVKWLGMKIGVENAEAWEKSVNMIVKNRNIGRNSETMERILHLANRYHDEILPKSKRK